MYYSALLRTSTFKNLYVSYDILSKVCQPNNTHCNRDGYWSSEFQVVISKTAIIWRDLEAQTYNRKPTVEKHRWLSSNHSSFRRDDRRICSAIDYFQLRIIDMYFDVVIYIISMSRYMHQQHCNTHTHTHIYSKNTYNIHIQ